MSRQLSPDDQWRIVATQRDSDGETSTHYFKEQFVYHNPGLADPGASSGYIDSVILRDRDMTNGWTGASSDNVLEERIWYCQNWRADVVATLTSSGQMNERVIYGEYGDVFGIPRGDADGDGDVDNGNTDDTDQINTWKSGTYDVRGDLDLDGDVDRDDLTAAQGMAGTVWGWGVAGASAGNANGGNRKAYAGYELDLPLSYNLRIYHVRNRVYNANHGRWMTRDPIGYTDSDNLYQYAVSNPLSVVDPFGLRQLPKQLPEHTEVSPEVEHGCSVAGGGMCAAGALICLIPGGQVPGGVIVAAGCIVWIMPDIVWFFPPSHVGIGTPMRIGPPSLQSLECGPADLTVDPQPDCRKELDTLRRDLSSGPTRQN